MLIKLALPLIMVAVTLLLANCGGGEAPPESAPEEKPAQTQTEPVAPEPEPEPETEAKAEPEPAPPEEPAGPPRVRLETDKGTLVLELYPDRAPETVANFLQYVDDGFYDGTIFHRVIRNLIIRQTSSSTRSTHAMAGATACSQRLSRARTLWKPSPRCRPAARWATKTFP